MGGGGSDRVGAGLSLAFSRPVWRRLRRARFCCPSLRTSPSGDRLRRRGLPLAVMASGVVGAVLDSVLFSALAFGTVKWAPGLVGETVRLGGYAGWQRWRVAIRLALQRPRRSPHRRVQIGTDAWGTRHLAQTGRWPRAIHHVNGERTLAGWRQSGIGIGARWWHLFGCVWMGAEMTGRCGAGVTDEELGVAGAVKVLDLFSGIDGFPLDGCGQISTGCDLIRPSSSPSLISHRRPRRPCRPGRVSRSQQRRRGLTGSSPSAPPGLICCTMADGPAAVELRTRAIVGSAGAMETTPDDAKSQPARRRQQVDRCAARCRDGMANPIRGADRVLAGWGDSVLCAGGDCL